MQKYHHMEIPTTTPRLSKVYLKQFKIYCTDQDVMRRRAHIDRKRSFWQEKRLTVGVRP